MLQDRAQCRTRSPCKGERKNELGFALEHILGLLFTYISFVFCFSLKENDHERE